MLSFLASIGIGGIVKQIAAAVEARENAKTDQERIAADERIKALQARRDVMIAEGSTPVNSIIRALFALPVAIYYGKLFLWDKVLGWGATDPLSQNMADFAQIVVGFYFLAEVGPRIARAFRR